MKFKASVVLFALWWMGCVTAYRTINGYCPSHVVVSNADKRDCGAPGFSAAQCEAKNCCFDDAPTPWGVPQCYYPKVTASSPSQNQFYNNQQNNQYQAPPSYNFPPPNAPVSHSSSYQTYYDQYGNPIYFDSNNNQVFPNQQQQGGFDNFNSPAPASNNVNNMFQSLGIPGRPPQYQNQVGQGQGALGTNVAPPRPYEPYQPPSFQQPPPYQPPPAPQPPYNPPSSGGGKDDADIIAGLGGKCSLANSIASAELRERYQAQFKCTGNEPTVSKEAADQAVNKYLNNVLPPSLQGGGIGGPNPPVPSGPIGAQLPNYGGPVGGANRDVCNLLKSKNLGSSASLLTQKYGCSTSPFDSLLGGSVGGIPFDIFAGLLGLTDDDDDDEQKKGSINPYLIDPKILDKCYEERNKYRSCLTGTNINIFTERECFNIGCVFYQGLCFRCTKVPASAYVLQDDHDTCLGATKTKCPGFSTIQLLTQGGGFGGGGSSLGNLAALGLFGDDDDGGIDASTLAALSLFQGNQGGQGGLGGLGGGGGGSPFSNPLLLSSLFKRSGETSSNYYNPHSRQGLSSLLGGGGGGGLNNLLLQQLAGGGGGGGGGINNLLLNKLGGGGGSAADSLLGGIGSSGNSDDKNNQLRLFCQSKDCCWRPGGFFGGTCYAKVSKFGDSCIPTKTSGDCGKTTADIFARIVGGVSASSATDRPWMVLIKKRGSALVHCGGVLICSQWVLTTASCLERVKNANNAQLYVPDLDPLSLDIFVGTADPDSPLTTGEKVAVNRIFHHPLFTPTQDYNNIALIRIESLTFASNKHPACLPSLSSNDPDTGDTIYMTGFGETSTSVQSNLKELRFTVKSQSSCSSSFSGVFPRSGVFCAQSAIKNTDSCPGDGGSPALKYDASEDVWTVVGLNFGGSPNCRGSTPSLFTDISTFMPWITQTTNGCCTLYSSRTQG